MENNNGKKFSLDPDLDELIASYNGIRNSSPREGINKAKLNRMKKENLRNKPGKNNGKKYKLAEKTKNRVKIGIASILAVATICGISSCVANERKELNPQPSTTISTHVTQEESLRTQIKNAEDDFIDYYLEAYNKLNGTNYNNDYNNVDLMVSDLRQGVVFTTEDGKLVTRGSLPDETKKVLMKYGDVDLENGHERVIQIVTNYGKKVLGTYDFLNGEYIYSGNDLTDFEKSENEENFEEPTIENLGIDFNYMHKAADLERARGREDEDSLEIRLNDCKKAKAKVDARNAEKNITTENTTEKETEDFER